MQAHRKGQNGHNGVRGGASKGAEAILKLRAVTGNRRLQDYWRICGNWHMGHYAQRLIVCVAGLVEPVLAGRFCLFWAA